MEESDAMHHKLHLSHVRRMVGRFMLSSLFYKAVNGKESEVIEEEMEDTDGHIMSAASSSPSCPPRRDILRTRPERKILNVNDSIQQLRQGYQLEWEIHAIDIRRRNGRRRLVLLPPMLHFPFPSVTSLSWIWLDSIPLASSCIWPVNWV